MTEKLANAIFQGIHPNQTQDFTWDQLVEKLFHLKTSPEARLKFLRNCDTDVAGTSSCDDLVVDLAHAAFQWLQGPGGSSARADVTDVTFDPDSIESMAHIFALAAELSWLQRDLSLPELCDGQTSIFSTETIHTIAAVLPAQMRQCWRLIYDLKRDGAAFSTFCARTLGRAPCLVGIQSDDGTLLGGFSPCALKLGPQFFGDHSTFVFARRPGETLNIYSASGENSNFVYMNHCKEQLPNGLAFGGQLDFFGLWLEDSMDSARSYGPCSTFGSPCLAGRTTFKVEVVEVWALVEDEEGEEDAGGRGVLSDEETKNFLRTAGRTLHSDTLG